MPKDSYGLVLLVEDNAMQRRLYTDVLRAQGFTVFATENVKDAERFVRDNAPSVILLDVMMPEVDGIEGCARFRKVLGDSIPILFLTAADTMEMVMAAMKAGGDDYIVKSGPPVTLAERVKKWHDTPSGDLPERRAKVIAVLEARARSPQVAARTPGAAKS